MRQFHLAQDILRKLLNHGYRSCLPPQSCFSKQEFKTLKDLQKDDAIVIIKPDKGNGIEVLDRTDYISKMHDMLSLILLQFP